MNINNIYKEKIMSKLSNIFSQNKKTMIVSVAVMASLVVGGVGVACKNYFDTQAKIKAEKLAKNEQKNELKPEVKSESTQVPEAKPAESPAPVAENKPVVSPKTSNTTTSTNYTAPKPTKTETKPAYENVSVSLSKSGSSVVTTIGSGKAGTCYWQFKQYDTNGTKINYATASTPANGGSCSVGIPAGTWTKVYVDYKASDYSAKGSGYLMF